MALNGLNHAAVPLRIYSLIHSENAEAVSDTFWNVSFAINV